MEKSEIGGVAAVTAAISFVILIVQITREEYLSFLDTVTWKTYYGSQLIFMGLLAVLFGYLLAKLSSGAITAREFAAAAKSIKNIPELDKKTQKKRAGELVFFVSPTTDLKINRGNKLEISPEKPLSFEQLKTETVRVKTINKFIVAVVVILVVVFLVSAVYFPEIAQYLLEEV